MSMSWLVEKRDEEIAELRRQLAEAQQELKDHEASFNLRWESDMRAIRRWQEAHPGNDNVWPDHTDLSVWLMGERDTYARLLLEAKEGLEDVSPSGNCWCEVGRDVQDFGHSLTCQGATELIGRIAVALKPGVSEPASEPKGER